MRSAMRIGMIVAMRQERHAVSDANALRLGRDEGEKDLRRGGVRILVEPVMLDFPNAVIAELVGEHRLLEAIAKELRFAGARRREICIS